MLERILQFDINIFAVFLLITMLIIVRIKGDRHSYSSGLFRIIIYLTGAALILEAVSWIADYYAGDPATFINYASNWLLVLVGPMLSGFWVSYVDYKILQDRKRIRRLLHYQFGTLFTLVTLGINFFVPVYFTIVGANEYVVGPFGWLNLVIMFGGLAYSAWLTVRHRDKTNIGVIRGVMAFFILPALGTVIQTFYIGFFSRGRCSRSRRSSSTCSSKRLRARSTVSPASIRAPSSTSISASSRNAANCSAF